MAITKVSRGLLSTGISDSSDATAVTITSDEDFLVRQTSADVYDTNSGSTKREFWGNQFSGSNNTASKTIIGSASNLPLVGGSTQNASSKFIVNSYIGFGSSDQTAGGEDGFMAFYTSSGGAAGTEKARILSSGGITFNGDTAAANALDDYEEGTWTATLSFGGNSVGLTYSVRTGYYMKVGRIVTATLYVLLTDKGSSTGQLILSGLPYTALGSNAYAAASLHLNLVSFSGFPQAYVVNGSTLAYFGQTADSGTFTQLTNSNISNTTGIIFTVTYQTA